jgi:hypothetical protein
VKISAFDFAAANSFDQNAWPKDQEFAVCEAGGVPGGGAGQTTDD